MGRVHMRAGGRVRGGAGGWRRAGRETGVGRRRTCRAMDCPVDPRRPSTGHFRAPGPSAAIPARIPGPPPFGPVRSFFKIFPDGD